MTNWGLILCQYDKGRKALTIRMAVKLNKAKIPSRTEYGIISPVKGASSMLPHAPNNDVWRFFGGNNVNEWLLIENGKFLGVFLTYDNGGRFFDIFQVQGAGRSNLLEGPKLKYVQDNLVDHVVITSAGGPLDCNFVTKVVDASKGSCYKNLNKFLKGYSLKSPMPLPLSMNRCGSNKPNSFRYYSRFFFLKLLPM